MSNATLIFGHYGSADPVPRQWLTAGPASVLVGAALFLVAARTVVVTHERPEAPPNIIFVDTIQKPQEAPKVEAPLLRVPPRNAAEPPRSLPQAMPVEAEPVQTGAPVVWIPTEDEYARGMRTADGEAKELREDDLPGAVRAVPLRGNQPPPYPKAARDAGKEATVTLKIRIAMDGRVADVEVMEGEEPFTTAAIDTVRNWRYTPASFQGKAISVFRVIKIAFQLS